MQAALDKRPNQAPLIDALKATLSYQRSCRRAVRTPTAVSSPATRRRRPADRRACPAAAAGRTGTTDQNGGHLHRRIG